MNAFFSPPPPPPSFSLIILKPLPFLILLLLLRPLICGSSLRVVAEVLKLAWRSGFLAAAAADALCNGLNAMLSLIGVEVRNLLGCDSLAKNFAVLLMPPLLDTAGVDKIVIGFIKSTDFCVIAVDADGTLKNAEFSL